MVVIYTDSQNPKCPPCHTVKYWLAKHGIEFEERERDETVRIIPTTVVGEQRVEGGNIPRLRELILEQNA